MPKSRVSPNKANPLGDIFKQVMTSKSEEEAIGHLKGLENDGQIYKILLAYSSRKDIPWDLFRFALKRKYDTLLDKIICLFRMQVNAIANESFDHRPDKSITIDQVRQKISRDLLGRMKPNPQGNTVLHDAVTYREQKAPLLAQLGFNPFTKNSDGKSPVELAFAHEKGDLAMQLITPWKDDAQARPYLVNAELRAAEERVLGSDQASHTKIIPCQAETLKAASSGEAKNKLLIAAMNKIKERHAFNLSIHPYPEEVAALKSLVSGVVDNNEIFIEACCLLLSLHACYEHMQEEIQYLVELIEKLESIDIISSAATVASSLMNDLAIANVCESQSAKLRYKNLVSIIDLLIKRNHDYASQFYNEAIDRIQMAILTEVLNVLSSYQNSQIQFSSIFPIQRAIDIRNRIFVAPKGGFDVVNSMLKMVCGHPLLACQALEVQPDGLTLIHQAYRDNKVDVFKVLTESVSAHEADSKQGMNILQYAIDQSRCSKIYDKKISMKAVMQCGDLRALLSHQDNQGDTAMHMIARHINASNASIFVTWLEVIDTQVTALDQSASEEDVESYKSLFSELADIKNKFGDTPQDILNKNLKTVFKKHANNPDLFFKQTCELVVVMTTLNPQVNLDSIIEKYIDFLTNSNLKEEFRDSILMFLSKLVRGRDESADSIRNKEGLPIFWIALKDNNRVLVDWCLEHDSDTNRVIDGLNTVMHYAVDNQSFDLINRVYPEFDFDKHPDLYERLFAFCINHFDKKGMKKILAFSASKINQSVLSDKLLELIKNKKFTAASQLFQIGQDKNIAVNGSDLLDMIISIRVTLLGKKKVKKQLDQSGKLLMAIKAQMELSERQMCCIIVNKDTGLKEYLIFNDEIRAYFYDQLSLELLEGIFAFDEDILKDFIGQFKSILHLVLNSRAQDKVELVQWILDRFPNLKDEAEKYHEQAAELGCDQGMLDLLASKSKASPAPNSSTNKPKKKKNKGINKGIKGAGGAFLSDRVNVLSKKVKEKKTEVTSSAALPIKEDERILSTEVQPSAVATSASAEVEPLEIKAATESMPEGTLTPGLSSLGAASSERQPASPVVFRGKKIQTEAFDDVVFGAPLTHEAEASPKSTSPNSTPDSASLVSASAASGVDESPAASAASSVGESSSASLINVGGEHFLEKEWVEGLPDGDFPWTRALPSASILPLGVVFGRSDILHLQIIKADAGVSFNFVNAKREPLNLSGCSVEHQIFGSGEYVKLMIKLALNSATHHLFVSPNNDNWVKPLNPQASVFTPASTPAPIPANPPLASMQQQMMRQSNGAPGPHYLGTMAVAAGTLGYLPGPPMATQQPQFRPGIFQYPMSPMGFIQPGMFPPRPWSGQ